MTFNINDTHVLLKGEFFHQFSERHLNLPFPHLSLHLFKYQYCGDPWRFHGSKKITQVTIIFYVSVDQSVFHV